MGCARSSKTMQVVPVVPWSIARIMRRIIAVRCDDVSVSEDERADALDRMGRETFDVVVVGGGIVGCGAALDAASRGLSVALVERGELASGTSSRSSKLIHGGLRYLERLQL